MTSGASNSNNSNNSSTTRLASAELHGGCVCGNVRYVTSCAPMRITVCHCTWCQKRTGTSFGTECVFQLNAVTLQGEGLHSYRHISNESGRWVEQDFCSDCGSNIGLRLEAVPQIRSLAMGSFDELSWLDAQTIPVRHVFTRSAMGMCLIPDGVEQFDRHFRE